ncbi:MAG: YidC/Oxa1 family membrane protein insertase [Treponema sp.]|nr:YidC/Oxa1 family membrane protein insertase [Treponema sp.]
MFLYNLIIHPIRQLLEICYIFFTEVTHNPGISVIGLSFVVTICCLPLYIVAEGWQEKERLIQKKLKPGLQRIKQAFRGDEQFMMLNTYYRQNHYHPMMALRSSFGLLIQIPFFIAAYSFLSHLGELNGVSFLFIRNMGKPDALFTIGGFTINVLPITMTAINCISGAVYAHGHDSVREKIQIYVSALLFLVLLYTSPAGLVMYWTMNNLLSLVKNVFYKLKNPLKTLYLIAAGASLLGIVLAAFVLTGAKIEVRALFALLCLTIIASPLLVKAVVWFSDRFLSDITENKARRCGIFVLSSLLIAFLTGLFIPAMLIESEPQEFCFVDGYTSPFIFLWTPFFQALGFYVLWPVCFYALFGTRIKKLLTLSAAFLALYALINNFAFTGSYGPLQPNLDFMEAQFFNDTLPRILLNALVALGAFAGITLLLSKKAYPLIPCSLIVLFALTAVSARNGVIVSKAFAKMTAPEVRTSIDPVYHLSKTGKNVIVFMQDRLFSPLLDEVFEEKPELVTHFDGFTFYPNTVSLGHLTMLGVPGIFGGYSYTPAEINRRDTETLQKKHNEAILSLPVTFNEAGFEVTVSDMPYENFDKEPLTAMYEGYPFVNRVWTQGVYSDYWYQQNGIEKTSYISDSIKHNFIMFGIFKTFPPVLRRLVHHKRWWNTDGRKDHFSQFIDNYSCLLYFPQLFDASAEKSTFTMIDNLATHEPSLLQWPDYVPVKEVTAFGPDKWSKNPQYNTQAGTMRCYAAFFDWLKKNDLYDNTRIIIVSDHGTSIKSGKFENTGDMPFLKEHVTASLLVKDFNDRTPSRDGTHLNRDMRFMTNADTPALATDGIIPGAKNPFTGLDYALSPEEKQAYVKICKPQAESTRNRYHTQFTIPHDVWWTVHGDITKSENWEQIFPFGK